ncbi:MAG: MFS transporter [Dehalococcoidia bacterium]
MATDTAHDVAGPGRIAALDALQVRDFRYLWFNAFSFYVSRGMGMIATSWLVLDMTDSRFLVGAVLFVQGAPLALFSLPAGIMADRVDRRWLLIVSQGATTAATGVLTVLIVAGIVTTWEIFALAFAMGSAMALGQPPRQALVPALVGPDKLMNAIVLNNLIQNLSFVIGPAFAGVLLATTGFSGTFIAQVALLAVGLPWLLSMRSPRVERVQKRASGLADLREGLAHIGDSPFILSLFAVTAFTGVFFVGSYQALVPIFARDVLDVGSLGLGMLSAAFGAGMFAGSIYIASRGNFARKGEVLLISLLIGSVVFLVFALSRWYALSLVTMVAWGFGAAFFMNLTMTLIQSHTPDRLMGRVMAVQALAFYGMSPVGNLVGGAIAQLANAPAAAVVGAVAVGLMSAYFFLRRPELREAT